MQRRKLQVADRLQCRHALGRRALRCGRDEIALCIVDRSLKDDAQDIVLVAHPLDRHMLPHEITAVRAPRGGRQGIDVGRLRCRPHETRRIAVLPCSLQGLCINRSIVCNEWVEFKCRRGNQDAARDCLRLAVQYTPGNIVSLSVGRIRTIVRQIMAQGLVEVDDHLVLEAG